MITWVTVVKAIIVAVFTFASTGLPFLIKFINAYKESKAATTAADKEKAYNDMLATAQSFIVSVEAAYKGFDAVMKSQGSSAGSMKKETVETKLQAYALSKGYEFDAEYWSKKIDELVKFTKEVNARR